MMIKESLILRVLTISFIFLALPLLITIFSMFQFGYNQALKAAKADLEASSLRRSSFLLEIKPFSKAFVAEAAYILDLKNKIKVESSQNLNSDLHKIVEHLDANIELNVLSPPHDFRYKVIASTNPLLIGTDFYSDYNIPRGKPGEVTTFLRYQFYPNQDKGSYIIYDSYQIYDENGVLIGVLLATTDIGKHIESVISLSKELHPNMKYALIEKDGVVVDSSNPSLIGQYFKPITPKQKKIIFEEMRINSSSDFVIADKPLDIKWDKTSQFFEFTVDDEVQIGYFAQSKNPGLSFVTYAAKKSIFSSAVKDFLIIYNGFGLIILIGVGISIWLSGKVAKPLQQLTNRMQKVSSGDLSSRFSAEPFGFEINALGKIFNQTLDALLEQIRSAEDFRVKKEGYFKELEIGYEVQRELLPKQMPKIKGVQFSASFIPSNVAHGDFFDCILKDPNKAFLVIADMPSLGISSSFYALNMRSLLRSHIALDETIEEIVNSANSLFCKDVGDEKILVSSFLALFDPENKVLTSVIAGQQSALIRRKNGAIETISAKQNPFGLKADTRYAAQAHHLLSGDMLLLYTQEDLTQEAKDKVVECLKKEELPRPLIDALTTEIAALGLEKDILFLALFVE